MRYWTYVEPAGSSSHPVYTIMSDAAVLATYRSHWTARMMQKYGGCSSEITDENCIQDWVTLNWAEEATPEIMKRILEDG